MQQYCCLPTFFSLHMLRTAGPEIGKFVESRFAVAFSGQAENQKEKANQILGCLPN